MFGEECDAKERRWMDPSAVSSNERASMGYRAHIQRPSVEVQSIGSEESEGQSCLLISITALLPTMSLQLRLTQDPPMSSRPPWSIERFQIFHLHSRLRWSSLEDRNRTTLNKTFLAVTHSNGSSLFETRDVYYRRDLILQIESNCTESAIDYSFDYGSTWSGTIDDDESQFSSIIRRHENRTVSRLTFPLATIPLDYFSVRFRWRFSHSCHPHSLQYVSLGDRCPMNCYGHARCDRGQCQAVQPAVPLVSSVHSPSVLPFSNKDRLCIDRLSRDIRSRRAGNELASVRSTSTASESDPVDHSRSTGHHSTDRFTVHTVLCTPLLCLLKHRPRSTIS